jgi:NAD(P)H dehydrogenase (quinone)
MTVFLVTGVTGNLGGAAVDSLLERVPMADIRVLVRSAGDAVLLSARGLAVRVGDYSDRSSLDAAFSGVDRMIFVSSPVLDPVIRAAQHRGVVESAAAVGVTHVVYTSAMGAPHDPGHSAAEESLVASGTGHTILRNALYTDPFVAQAISDSRKGTITSASEGQSVVTAAISDLGEAAAISVFNPPAKHVWELRGPAWTFDELAQTMSHLSGRPIMHKEVADNMTGAFAVLFPLIRRGVFTATTDDLALILGRRLQGIADIAARLLR